MKTEKIFKGWSSLQKTLLGVFESSVKWSVSCTELLAQLKAAEIKEMLYLFLCLLLMVVSVLTAFQVGDLVYRNMFGYNVRTITYLVGVFSSVFGSLHMLNRSTKQRQGLDQDSLRVWDDVCELFRKINEHKQIHNTFSPAELVAYLDDEVRYNVREIRRIEEAIGNPMSKATRHLKDYLWNLMALVVRMEIMNVREISIGIVDAESALYDERADWFFKKLFKDPDFVITPESAQSD